MVDIHRLCAGALETVVQQGGSRNISPDTVGRAMLSQVIALWAKSRPPADIEQELRAAAENVAADEEYPFSRP